eukprot:g1326.t1
MNETSDLEQNANSKPDGGPSKTSGNLERIQTQVKYVGAVDVDSKRAVNLPVEVLSQVAHIQTKFYWFDVIWLISVTFLTPAAFALVWFGLIPLGNAEGDFAQKVVWVFIINAGTYVFFSFMLVNIFLACLDGNHPWRPFKYYVVVLLINYVLQVGIVGTIVFVHGSFRALGLVAIAISLFSTCCGLKMTPHYYFDCDLDRYKSKLSVFVKILQYFAMFWIVLVGYIIANSSSDSSAQGFLTVALSIITFIFKKIFLGLTDHYPLEIAMVIAGLWLENIVDLFIALAYPTASQAGFTYFVIWLTRVAENIAYLGFQFEAWFKFRIWIKGKFKPEQNEAVEEDVNPDDRGHSNQHPGYRRRQMRFLAWKLLSQLSAGIFFLVNIPVLRFGENKHDYPYSRTGIELDTLSDHAGDPFEHKTFQRAMAFAAFSMFTTICSGIIIFWWMQKYHPETLESLKERYRYLILSDKYFGFVLTVLISNVLLAVSAVQVNNRLYFI